MRWRQHAPLWVRPARQHFSAYQPLPLKGDFRLEVGLELAIVQASFYILQGGQLGRLEQAWRRMVMGLIMRGQAFETLQIEGLAQVTEECQPKAMDHRNSRLTQDRVQLAAQYHCTHFAQAADVAQKCQAIHAGHFQITQDNVDLGAAVQDRDGFVTIGCLQNRARQQFF
ncbi:hypothetical protein D3C78_1107530 [compost metagenome]